MHLPGCLRPWTFSLNVGLIMLSSDYHMSCFDFLPGYSIWEFRAFSQDKKLKYSSRERTVGIFEEMYFICCLYMTICAESISAVCQAVNDAAFPQIVKFKMAVIGHIQFNFFVIFVHSFFVWRPWFIEIYLRCLALMIWDMTSNGTRYVIEISWIRAPTGMC